MPKRRLVVIGGGVAGHLIAHTLKSSMAVSLIDPKSYFEVPMALPRLLVAPDALPARLPYAGFLSGVTLVRGRATAIDDTGVTVVEDDNSERLVGFDYAVIATGSRYRDPLIKAEAVMEADRRDQIAAAHRRLADARQVVVVGGGPVGVEVAAELRESLSHLDVTLVHDRRDLLEGTQPRFGAWAKTALAERRVTLVLGETVIQPALGDQPANGVVVTQSGRSLPADVVVWAVGTRPSTDFVTRSWPDAVEPKGLIKVDEFLRVRAHPKVFAVGDVVALPESRLATVAGFHAQSVIANLRKLAAASGAVALKPYTAKPPRKGLGRMMIVTLGRLDGLSSLPFGQFRASFVARNIKSKNMFVNNYRKKVGLGPT